jgi:hypothetical protein
MYEYQRRIINEGIKHGATKHPSGIGVQKETQSDKWDEIRDGWEGKQDIEEAKKVVENDEEGDDYNAEMAIAQLKIVVEKANDLLSMLTPDTELETWVQSKITMAEDYITTVRDYVKHGGDEVEEAASPKPDDRLEHLRKIADYNIKQWQQEMGWIRKRQESDVRALKNMEKMLEKAKKLYAKRDYDWITKELWIQK